MEPLPGAARAVRTAPAVPASAHVTAHVTGDDAVDAAAPAARRRARPGRRGAAALLAATLAVTLAGCGLRVETAPPGEPVPGALEQARRTAVDDALLVAQDAEAAASPAAGPAPADAVAAELERVAAQSREHAAALGGVYDSGIPDDLAEDLSDDPSGAASPSPSAVTAAPADVVAALGDAAARTRAAAGTTSDGPLARLLASVSAAQAVSAARLAEAADVAAPERSAPVVPAATASPSASPTPSDDASTPVATSSPGAGADQVPEGLTADDLAALVASEDAAGYALELRAARASGDARRRLAERARVHRERAQDWAVLGRLDGTDQDPRRVAYAVPADLDDAALVRLLEEGLATGYASLVGTTAAGTRTVLVDLLADGALTLDAWGADPADLPGMPEQGASASPSPSSSPSPTAAPTTTPGS